MRCPVRRCTRGGEICARVVHTRPRPQGGPCAAVKLVLTVIVSGEALERIELERFTTVRVGRAADCVVVTCRHTGTDFDSLARMGKVIVDTRNAYPLGYQVPEGGARIIKL